MHKYGILKNEILTIVPKGTPGAKLIKYAKIPEFDQEFQAVFEKEPVDMSEYIFIDVEVRDVEQDEEADAEML